mgnify:CR=1 FL=1
MCKAPNAGAREMQSRLGGGVHMSQCDKRKNAGSTLRDMQLIA